MLGSILVVVGFVLIGIGVLAKFVVPLFTKRSSEPRTNLSTGGFVVFILAGSLLASMNSMLFYAEPGYSYLVQFPTGQQISVLEPGYHWRVFGNLLPFKKVLTVKFTHESSVDAGSPSGVQPPIEIRFNDAVTANVELAVRFRLPEDPEKFKHLALDFRTQKNLINASLIPVAREVVRNSGRILSAQAYIIGRGGEFENAVLDQLEKGIYILETTVFQTKRPEEIIQEEGRKLEQRETVKYDVRKKVDADGNLIRKRHTLSEYDLVVAQATVEHVDPEPKFKEMLSQQRDAAAAANVERQMAKKAEFERQRIIASGEAEKARIRVEQEKEQIEILIREETSKKEEAIRVEKKRLELERARLESEAIRVKSEAEAYARRAMMQADNALEIRLNALVEINRAYAEALKDKSIVPKIVVSSGGNGKGQQSSAFDLVNLLVAKTAKDLAVDLPK